MGTITYLKDRLRRARAPAGPAVTVTAYGFAMGADVFIWQNVSEIRACRPDHAPADAAFLEFAVAGRCIAVGQAQVGFAALETAMIAAFPATACWREAMLLPGCARQEALLYRR